MPTLAKSSYQAISSGQSGKAIYLTPTDAPPGSFIKILLILSPGMRVLFESNTININNRSIIFGSEYLDFGGKGQVNIYTLELKTYLAINADRIVVVGLYVYSGKVSMSLSFHEDMSNPLPITPIINLGRYSLTPELRL